MMTYDDKTNNTREGKMTYDDKPTTRRIHE